MSALRTGRRLVTAVGLFLAVSPLVGGCASSGRPDRGRAADSFEGIVWPPPPDEPRIKLEAVLLGRLDVEARSRFRRRLATSVPQTPYDWLRKPYAVAFDADGRILVTDSGSSALLRFDRSGRRMDVFGVRSSVRLELPLGLAVGPDGVIYVADAGVGAVIAFDSEGDIRALYGQHGELTNPTDAAISPDGARLYVTDSRGHRIVVFDLDTRRSVHSFGARGSGPGEFSFPTSLDFGPTGELFVVDQLNARVQILDPEGGFLEEFGGRGIDFGRLVRPKDVVVDETGLVYVVDNAFNNIQLFDSDLALLTFVGQAGVEPGQFLGASGIAVHGEEFAVVDQLGHRLQVFQFLRPKTADFPVGRRGPGPIAAAPVAEARVAEVPVAEAPVAEAPAADRPASGPTAGEAATGETGTGAKSADLPAPPGVRQIRRDLGRLLFDWYRTWVDGRSEAHLAFYSEGFDPPAGSTREAWERRRRQAIAATAGRESGLEYRLEEFDAAAAKVRLIGGPEGAARVRLLLLRREGAVWRIYSESVEESEDL
jgi:sugar lactone lactonase YvrE